MYTSLYLYDWSQTEGREAWREEAEMTEIGKLGTHKWPDQILYSQSGPPTAPPAWQEEAVLLSHRTKEEAKPTKKRNVCARECITTKPL